MLEQGQFVYTQFYLVFIKPDWNSGRTIHFQPVLRLLLLDKLPTLNWIYSWIKIHSHETMNNWDKVWLTCTKWVLFLPTEFPTWIYSSIWIALVAEFCKVFQGVSFVWRWTWLIRLFDSNFELFFTFETYFCDNNTTYIYNFFSVWLLNKLCKIRRKLVEKEMT